MTRISVMTHRQEFRIGMIRPDVSRLHPVVTLKMGKKIGQNLAIFQPDFCPNSTCLSLKFNH